MIIDQRKQKRKITISLTANVKNMNLDYLIDNSLLEKIKETIEKEETYSTKIEITIE